MRAHSTFFSIMARCLSCSVALAVLGLTWGCGDGAQSTPDEATKAKIHEIEVKVKEAHAKKRAP